MRGRGCFDRRCGVLTDRLDCRFDRRGRNRRGSCFDQRWQRRRGWCGRWRGRNRPWWFRRRSGRCISDRRWWRRTERCSTCITEPITRHCLVSARRADRSCNRHRRRWRKHGWRIDADRLCCGRCNCGQCRAALFAKYLTGKHMRTAVRAGLSGSGRWRNRYGCNRTAWFESCAALLAETIHRIIEGAARWTHYHSQSSACFKRLFL